MTIITLELSKEILGIYLKKSKLKIVFMKKVLVSIGGLLIAAVFVVSFTYTDGKTTDNKKARTEICKDNTAGSNCASACQKSEACKAACTKDKADGKCCKAADGSNGKECSKAAGECPGKETKACCKASSSGDCKSSTEGLK